MAYYTFNYLPLFVWVYWVNVAGAMKLSLTATIPFASVKNFINVRSFTTAFVFIKSWRTTNASPCFNSRLFRMKATITHLSYWIIFLAPIASDKIKVRPNFPVNFLPAISKCFPNISYELFKIPISVNHMFCPHLTVSVDTLKTISACKDFPLFFCEEFIAISTFVKVIFLLF